MYRSTPSTASAINARKSELMNSFCTRLETESGVIYREIVGHKAFARVSTFKLPGQACDSTAMFWAGEGIDPSKNGVPIVSLLQGERDRDTNLLHPERLPGGKTAIQQVNSRLAKQDAPYAVSLVFIKSTKELEVYVIDLDRVDEWHSRTAKAPTPPPKAPTPPPTVVEVAYEPAYKRVKQALMFSNFLPKFPDAKIVSLEDYEDYIPPEGEMPFVEVKRRK